MVVITHEAEGIEHPAQLQDIYGKQVEKDDPVGVILEDRFVLVAAGGEVAAGARELRRKGRTIAGVYAKSAIKYGPDPVVFARRAGNNVAPVVCGVDSANAVAMAVGSVLAPLRPSIENVGKFYIHCSRVDSSMLAEYVSGCYYM